MAGRARAFGPGRVNLIGEHTDYNGGLALPFAVDDGIVVDGQTTTERTIEVIAHDLGEQDEFELDHPRGAAGWRAFPRGAVGELQRAGVDVPGARLQIRSDLPLGAGLSSSAALEVALVLALLALADVKPPDRRELAMLCSRIEHDWVGANTGLLDQLASLCCTRDHALRIDFRTLELTSVPLALEGHKLVTLDSGERHENATSGYNERRAECKKACALLGVETLSEATLEQAEDLPEPLRRRARHVITENARVDQMVAALGRGDLDEVGRLLDASHESLRDCFEVSTDAVEATVERVRKAGALGARIVGGGFGGAVLALMPPGAEPPAGGRELRSGEGAYLID